MFVSVSLRLSPCVTFVCLWVCVSVFLSLCVTLVKWEDAGLGNYQVILDLYVTVVSYFHLPSPLPMNLRRFKSTSEKPQDTQFQRHVVPKLVYLRLLMYPVAVVAHGIEKVFGRVSSLDSNCSGVGWYVSMPCVVATPHEDERLAFLLIVHWFLVSNSLPTASMFYREFLLLFLVPRTHGASVSTSLGTLVFLKFSTRRRWGMAMCLPFCTPQSWI